MDTAATEYALGMLTVSVLGPVELVRDGVPVGLPTGKTTEVLVRLALDAGQVVSVDRLIEDLWADSGRTGRNTLQSKVSQLRRALAEPALVTSASRGYTLAIDPACVDALRVVGLASSAAAARRAGDASTTLALAEEALALYRGEVLVDAGEGDWLQVHRARLEELRLELLEDRYGARVDLGAGGEVVSELEALTALHPLREGLWSSLITALYRAGRQADALAAYGRVRTVLVDELGIEPGPGLQALEAQVLHQSADLASPGGAREQGSARGLGGTPGNLPSLTSLLVGRREDLATLDTLTREHRLVTLVGPAGVGKTRLALEAARGWQVPGGVWLVRLDTAGPDTSITRVVAETLHLTGGEQSLGERLAGAETVLVLDNCEQVVESVANAATVLLDAAPPLRLLVTSQLPLGLDGEVVHQVQPLATADSVALFEARATSIRSQFALDADTAPVVEEVCVALDGLPLAIELAAARVKSLSVQEISRRLDDRFTLLRDPTSRLPERRRVLSAAIAWSYDLLFPDDQTGLWALACFDDGAPLDAAEQVLAVLGVPRDSAIDIISRLVDRSLVAVEVNGRGSVRYRLLDSIRAFAVARLTESGHRDAAAAAHADWYAALADECAASVRGRGQADCVRTARDERANIDAALAWTALHDPGLGLRIANGFGWTWVVLGDGVAGAHRMREAVSRAHGSAPHDRAVGLLLAGWLEASAGNVEQADADLRRALESAEALGDRGLRADAQRHLAFLRIQQGRPGDVVELAGASVETCRVLDLDWEVAAGLLLRAYGSIMLGDTTTAASDAAEAVGVLAPLGDSWGQVHAEAMLGAIAQAQHRFGDAAGHLARAASSSEDLGFVGQAALHLATLGRVQQRAGDPEGAGATLNRAITRATQGGDLRLAATARLYLARLVRGCGDAEAARVLLEENDRWYRSAGGGEGALLTRCLLAAVTAEADPDAASAVLREVGEEGRRLPDPEVQLFATDAMARLAAEAGDREQAQRLLAEGDELAEAVRHVVDEGDRVDAQSVRALLADS